MHPVHALAAVRAALVLAITLALGTVAGSQPAGEPPPQYGPVSISLEDVAYPYPVQFLPLTLYGKDVRMAYMDVAPEGEPNGRTVVLFHDWPRSAIILTSKRLNCSTRSSSVFSLRPACPGIRFYRALY